MSASEGKNNRQMKGHPLPSFLTPNSIIDVQKIEFVGVDRTKLTFFDRELKDAKVISRAGTTTSIIEKKGKKEIEIHSKLQQANPKLELAEFFEHEKSIPTLNNVHSALNQFTSKMVNTDFFEFVDTNLQIDNGLADKFPATVIITLKEKQIPFCQAQAYSTVGDSSDSGLEISGGLRNPTGNGESIKLGAVGKALGQEYFLSASIPHISDSNNPFNITLKSREENNFYHASFKQYITSVVAEYTHDPKLKHHFIAEYSIRDEIPMLLTDSNPHYTSPLNRVGIEQSLQRQANEAVLATAMSSIKTSLKYVWSAVDTRNSISNPTTGEYLQASVELALPPGNAQFVKTDVTSQFHRQLGPNYLQQPGLTFSLSSSIGMLYPLSVLFPALYHNKSALRGSTSPLTSFLSDRYHLGGPFSLRGFDSSGVGPKDGKSIFPHIGQSNDSLGGDTKSTLIALLSVPVPIPPLANYSMRAFWFFNAGSLGNSNYWKMRILEKLQASSTPGQDNYVATELKGKTSPLFGYLRASVGSGFSVSILKFARVEVTYSIPLIGAQNDQLQKFQFGVGVSIN